MGHEIVYTSRLTGQQHTQPHRGSDGTASGWAKGLAEANGCKAECYRVNADGSRTHVASYGDTPSQRAGR